jgi:energy-coupling factor transporter ATP-binding protein EcfA2
MRRVKLPFAPGLEVEFADRDKALQQVLEWSERGTRFPIVVFGPEGCGKTAWLKQAAGILRERGYEVVYVDPMHREYLVHTDVKEVAEQFAKAAAEAVGTAELKLASLAIDAVKELLKAWRRKNVAVLVDEAFQAVGLERAAAYVKSLLNLIEYPPESYEKIVAVAATSEGLSRKEIGRHLWAELAPMWNMSREGFERLYEQLPGPKPDIEEAWKLTGGNPRLLAQLYRAKWNVETVVAQLAKAKGITAGFAAKWGRLLREAVEDPDALWSAEGEELAGELEARNLIVYNLYDRSEKLWIDQPPPQKDLELGIGKYVAWQTPLHREAVRRTLEKRA